MKVIVINGAMGAGKTAVGRVRYIFRTVKHKPRVITTFLKMS